MFLTWNKRELFPVKDARTMPGLSTLPHMCSTTDSAAKLTRNLSLFLSETDEEHYLFSALFHTRTVYEAIKKSSIGQMAYGGMHLDSCHIPGVKNY